MNSKKRTKLTQNDWYLINTVHDTGNYFQNDHKYGNIFPNWYWIVLFEIGGVGRATDRPNNFGSASQQVVNK